MKFIKNRAGVTLVEVMASVFVMGISLIFVGLIVNTGLVKYRELRAYEDTQRNAFRILVNLYKGAPIEMQLPHVGRYKALIGLQNAVEFYSLNDRMIRVFYNVPQREAPNPTNSSYADFRFTPNGNDSGLIWVKGQIVEQKTTGIHILGSFSNSVIFPENQRDKGIPFNESAYETDEEITSISEDDGSNFTPYKFIIEEAKFELVKFNGSQISLGSNDYIDSSTNRKVRNHDGVKVTLTCLYRYPALNPYKNQLRTRRIQFSKIITRK